jgi:biotin transporter BioY
MLRSVAGFVPATAFLQGVRLIGGPLGLWRSFVASAIAQGFVLACGAAWLSRRLALDRLFVIAVQPFLAGLFVKAALAALCVGLVERMVVDEVLCLRALPDEPCAT